MNESTEKMKMTREAVALPPRIEITVPLLGTNREFIAYFHPYDGATERQQRRIANRNARGGQLKQKDLEAAAEFVFDAKFDTTNADWSELMAEGGHVTEKEFFKKDADGRRYMLAMSSSYLEAVQIDSSYSKN